MKLKRRKIGSNVKARIIAPAERELHRLKPTSRVCTSLACMRIAAGITQQDMAQALGVTQGYISKRERDSADCDLTLGQITDCAQVAKWGKKLVLTLDVKAGTWMVGK